MTAEKRVAQKKYYAGREIGILKVRVIALEAQLKRSQVAVLERNKALRSLEKGRNQLRQLLDLARDEHFCGIADCGSPFCKAMRAAGEKP